MSAQNKLKNKQARRVAREARKAAFHEEYKRRAALPVFAPKIDLKQEEPKVSDLVIAESVLWTPDQEG